MGTSVIFPRNPAGMDLPVPGIDLDNDFQPIYVPFDGKQKPIRELKKVAKKSDDIWLATDLDREGRRSPGTWPRNWPAAGAVQASRLQRGDQAGHRTGVREPPCDRHGHGQCPAGRRILDRIVGYQVSPLLWKKVAGGLSAGRVQSVAVMLIVDRELLIRAHMPDESWELTGVLSCDADAAAGLVTPYAELLASRDERTRDRRSSSGRPGFSNTSPWQRNSCRSRNRPGDQVLRD
ncbi:MAG: hypothetical protein Ct9H300mP1_29190 [Planctomycetaceae bacterium]|nr:MAG: hypothetical protein Ct9H300mP1_29190 [Planctomycetaceae bacterium]